MLEFLDESSYFDTIKEDCLFDDGRAILFVGKAYAHWSAHQQIGRAAGADIIPRIRSNYTAVARVSGDIDTFLIMSGSDLAYQKLDDESHNVEIHGSPLFAAYLSQLNEINLEKTLKAIQALFICMAKRNEGVY